MPTGASRSARQAFGAAWLASRRRGPALLSRYALNHRAEHLQDVRRPERCSRVLYAKTQLFVLLTITHCLWYLGTDPYGQPVTTKTTISRLLAATKQRKTASQFAVFRRLYHRRPGVSTENATLLAVNLRQEQRKQRACGLTGFASPGVDYTPPSMPSSSAMRSVALSPEPVNTTTVD